MPVDKIVEELNKLSVLELVELKKSLEEAWDVSAAAAAPVMVAAPAGGGGGGGGEQEEQSSFDVVLTGTGDKKIQVIKVIRELTGLGLKEAKAVADEAPAPVKEGAAKDEAEQMKAKLEEAGATVELK
ncbi:MAG TPA: 50S ribosomal protein L7/L12 [Myxococcales bacterium]|jgi:large subunit ribosomal protein L7/L12|nr:50S ribosomal protein L7/L12 [Myxococcales bacterium]